MTPWNGKRSPIVAVDFDGTISQAIFPAIGPEVPGAFVALKILRAAGWRIILWTCRVGKPLEDAIDWCRENGVEFDAVNENLPNEWDGLPDCRKIFANVYIDDLAYGCDVNWNTILFNLLQVYDARI